MPAEESNEVALMLLIVISFVLLFFMSLSCPIIYVTDSTNATPSSDVAPTTQVSPFADLKDQPLRFVKEILAVPKGCSPYVGCMFPNTNSCTKAWKDCPAFADCKNNKCVRK